MIRVVNKHYHEPTDNDVYIGRGSALGNPYSHLSGTKAYYLVNTREEAIEGFEHWIEGQLAANNQDVKNALNKIYKMAKHGDVNLVCYCNPKSCHGDVIKRIIESKLPKFDITQAIRMMNI